MRISKPCPSRTDDLSAEPRLNVGGEGGMAAARMLEMVR
jgi:hypothetical protein